MIHHSRDMATCLFFNLPYVITEVQSDHISNVQYFIRSKKFHNPSGDAQQLGR